MHVNVLLRTEEGNVAVTHWTFCVIHNQFARAIHTVLCAVTVRAQNDCMRCRMNSCFGPVEGTILTLVWRAGLTPSDSVSG